MPDKPRKGLTPKQKKALRLLQRALVGEMTIEDALKQAGYSDATARQQKEVMDSLRQNSVMQGALRAALFDETLIAKKISDGINATYINFKGEELPSYGTQLNYLIFGAKLLDVLPAEKHVTTDVSLADLIKAQEATTPSSDV